MHMPAVYAVQDVQKSAFNRYSQGCHVNLAPCTSCKMLFRLFCNPCIMESVMLQIYLQDRNGLQHG